MITVTQHTSARPEQVWAVLADGWTYAAWVVGASRIRAVEGAWPEPGSRIHHSVGTWPALVNDETVVMASEPERLIRLKAKGKALGQAVVEISLHDEGDRTRIEMREDASDGLGRLIPHPVRQALIAPATARRSPASRCWPSAGARRWCDEAGPLPPAADHGSGGRPGRGAAVSGSGGRPGPSSRSRWC